MKNTDKRLLKFHGKFTDLIPYGFTFQKLFARNYRQYHFELEKYCESIRVWQAHGGYIEIDDLYGATKGLVEAVFNPEFKWHRYEMRQGFPHCDSWGYTIVRNTCEVIPLNYDKHDSMRTYLSMEREGKSEEERTKAIRAIHSEFRVERISQRMIKKLHEFRDLGWIKPTEICA